MNKDVIYIEPEQDITDILANIKGSKNKIVALVPPKKAGVLRSAVNFKLIAKAARQNEKTVVLITTDESLRRLAGSVAMPIAKNLQSKPQLPDDDDAIEFGDDKESDDTIDGKDEKVEVKIKPKEGEDEAEAKDDAPKAAPAAKKVPVAAAVKVEKKEPAEDVIEGEPEPEAEDDAEPKTKNEKAAAKMKGMKIPNFAKYRKYIIIGGVALVIIILFSFWANVIAPAAKISVKVHTTSSNFTEKITFVKDESKADPKKGIFYLEEKTIAKKGEKEFKATGKVDKGTKATGSITVNRAMHDVVNCDETDSLLSIPKNTTVTIDGKEFIVVDGGSANALDSKGQIEVIGRGSRQVCRLKTNITSGALKVVAKEVGEGYNIGVGKEIKIAINTNKKYTVTSTAMTGGSSKVVTVVSQEDFETASSDIEMPDINDIKRELESEFGGNYVLLGDMKQTEPKVISSPALNEEVGDKITPKISKEISYTMYAVQREAVETYIKTVVSSTLGDDTQMIYDTGIDKAFFEAFQNSADDNSAKLKTTVKTGPRVTDEMVREKCLGYKVGECQSRLKSINGVSSAKIDTSYFFVMSVPADTNKTEVNIELEK